MKKDILIDFRSMTLLGANIQKRKKLLIDCSFLFHKNKNFEDMNETIYEVEWHDNGVEEGAYGGLYFGITHVYQGDIDGEFYMTAGHMHQDTLMSEYYVGLKGKGLLLMVFPDGTYKLDEVKVGSVHYILGNTIHRLINIGEETLSVGACWQSASGHDYDVTTIPIRIFRDKEDGFKLLPM